MKFDQTPVFPETFTAEMRRLAEQAARGDASAQFELGEHYEDGRGVTQNHHEALHWFRKAAGNGLAEAKYRVGLCYANGQGVEKNMQLSLKWHHEAGAQGCTEAQHALGTMYARGNGVEQDFEKAAAWFLAAARAGDSRAQLVYGLMLRDGRGISKDLSGAYVWLKTAEDRHASAERRSIASEALAGLRKRMTADEIKRAEMILRRTSVPIRPAADGALPDAGRKGAAERKGAA